MLTGAMQVTLRERYKMTVIEGPRTPVAILLRAGIVILALASAYIHTTLGSMLFMGNALGYVVLAIAMIAPVAILAKYRWLVRAALLAFTIATIVGWILFGARYFMGYLDKALEIVLIVLLLIEMVRYDGGPVAVFRRAVDLGLAIVRKPFGGKGAA